MHLDFVVDHTVPCCPRNLFYSVTLFCPALVNIDSQSPPLSVLGRVRATERYQPIPDGFHNVGLRGWVLKRRLISFVEYDKPCTRAQLSRHTEEAKKKTKKPPYFYFFIFYFYINQHCSETTGYRVMVSLWSLTGQDVWIHKCVLQFYTLANKACLVNCSISLLRLCKRWLRRLSL